MTSGQSLHAPFRQMIALLEGERQALAALDLERILACAAGKLELCDRIESGLSGKLDDEARGLLDAITRLNAINRKMRNLIAANIETRLGALTGRVGLYGGLRRTNLREIPR